MIMKGLMFLILFIIALIAFGFVTMSLWNAILPAVLGVKAISFMQALGILLLSKILFGGFGGRRWRGGNAWKQKIKQRFENMTPEDKEKFKAEWKSRCGGSWKKNAPTDENAPFPNSL